MVLHYSTDQHVGVTRQDMWDFIFKFVCALVQRDSTDRREDADRAESVYICYDSEF